MTDRADNTAGHNVDARGRTVRATGWTADRGSVVIWVAVTTPALLLTVMLIVDGAAKIRAAEQAGNYAAEAARAAAIAVGPRPAAEDVEVREASAAARQYLTASGVTGTVLITGSARVEVTVQVTVVGPISGVRFSSTRTATALLLIGLTRGQAP